MYSLISVSTEAEPALFFFSRAHCSLAPSTWRRLLIQAFFWAVVRALTKLGIAIAARRPMMATTIMISTRVKPALRELRIFILFFLPFSGGVNCTAGGLFSISVAFTYCLPQPHVV